ncbi:hypothetical protein HPB52_022953 [Rhipicephalus sanguineus]|uniref:THAP-type domain-containing protein n=1 Tax=Rhipicephalus sanguineus TaxID=34632 RepID=A0A9D4SV73_RHISA|nr:hypothetical protein HPB52_022953 [Rhipicephalus sanguineus]
MRFPPARLSSANSGSRSAAMMFLLLFRLMHLPHARQCRRDAETPSENSLGGRQGFRRNQPAGVGRWRRYARNVARANIEDVGVSGGCHLGKNNATMAGRQEPSPGETTSLQAGKVSAQGGTKQLDRGKKGSLPLTCKSPQESSLTGHLECKNFTSLVVSLWLNRDQRIAGEELNFTGGSAERKQYGKRTRVPRTPEHSRRSRLASIFKSSTGRRRIKAECKTSAGGGRELRSGRLEGHTTSGMGYSSDNEEVGNKSAVPEGQGAIRKWRGQENLSELRHFSKLIGSVLRKFPTEAEVPAWFQAAESALEGYDVRKAWWGQIIFPLVAEKIPFLSTRLAPPQHRDYEVLKGAVLDQMKLSAGEYLRRFRGQKKRAAEGYLRFYVEVRGVSAFEELVELFTADPIKDSLSDAALKYVTLQEGGCWRKDHAIAALLITYEEAEGQNIGSKKAERKIAEATTAGPQGRGAEAWKLLKKAATVRQTAHATQYDRRAKPTSVRVSVAVLAFNEQRSGKMFLKGKGPGRVCGKHRRRRHGCGVARAKRVLVSEQQCRAVSGRRGGVSDGNTNRELHAVINILCTHEEPNCVTDKLEGETTSSASKSAVASNLAQTRVLGCRLCSVFPLVAEAGSELVGTDLSSGNLKPASRKPIFAACYNQKKRKAARKELCGTHNVLQEECGCNVYLLHWFPADADWKRQWVAAVPSTSSRVCSAHFVDGKRSDLNPVPMLRLGIQ